jgi:DNA-directed RNA polymerase specialized sigma24 family protein
MAATPDGADTPGSVSHWVALLGEGDRTAVQRLWERYFQPLVRVARARLRGAPLCAAGAEDVALEAFLGLCERLARPDAAERFPELHNRNHLWRLLVCFTVREAFDARRKERRRAAVVAGESALGAAGFEPFAGREPPPEFAAGVGDLLDRLGDDDLRWLALRRLEGYTREEIARQRGWSVTAVDRKLKVIRTIWKDRAPREESP